MSQQTVQWTFPVVNGIDHPKCVAFIMRPKFVLDLRVQEVGIHQVGQGGLREDES